MLEKKEKKMGVCVHLASANLMLQIEKVDASYVGLSVMKLRSARVRLINTVRHISRLATVHTHKNMFFKFDGVKQFQFSLSD